MKSVICTLYEGNYHKGVAALINSLVHNGFNGDVVIGYRGALPDWADSVKHNPVLKAFEGKSFTLPNTGNNIHFVPMKSDTHFTNYKATFMMSVLEEMFLDADAIFYFDPDITNTALWFFYEEWVKCGVCVVHEVVWNDMPPTHPKRMQWKAVSDSIGLPIKNEMYSYLNAGFIGVHRSEIEFLRLWQRLMEHAVEKFDFKFKSFAQSKRDEYLFKVGDQDLFNLTAMLTDCKLSEFGPEGMGFVGGGWIMFHSTGSPKPWNKNYLKQFFKGKPPLLQDKEFWKYATNPIPAFSNSVVMNKKFTLKFTSFLSRFYKR